MCIIDVQKKTQTHAQPPRRRQQSHKHTEQLLGHFSLADIHRMLSPSPILSNTKMLLAERQSQLNMITQKQANWLPSLSTQVRGSFTLYEEEDNLSKWNLIFGNILKFGIFCLSANRHRKKVHLFYYRALDGK